MRKLNYKNNSELVNPIIFLLIGIILFLNPAGIVKFISYLIGIILIGGGIYNLLIYNKTSNNLNIQVKTKLTSGIILIVLGLITIMCAGVIESLLRFIIGGWITYSGIIRLIEAVNYKLDKPSSIIRLIISIIIIIFGLYIITRTNLVFSIIGLYMIIYSIIEICNSITK